MGGLAPTVTFIIPVRPGEGPSTALAGIAALRHPRDRIEVLVVEGLSPSRQRNQALARARGELIYFLDDDSRLEPDALERALECLDGPGVDGVGGPVLPAPTDGGFQRAAAAALGSRFGLGPFRHRWSSSGPIRAAGERELISANLIVRRSALVDFDERLYGNEENELMNRLRDRGARLVHHPRMIARRAMRSSLIAIGRQHFGYGRGRLRHFLIRPSSFEPVLLAPTGLVAALAAAPIWPHWLTLLPLALYAGCCALAAAIAGARAGRPAVTAARLAAIYPTMHLGYGIGMLAELGCRLV